MADETTNNNEIDSDVIVSALQFWKKVYDEKEVIIKFTKQDNTERTMRCTLDFSKIPEKDKPKSVNIQQILKLIQKNKIMHVYDLDKKGNCKVNKQCITTDHRQTSKFVRCSNCFEFVEVPGGFKRFIEAKNILSANPAGLKKLAEAFELEI